MKYQRPYLVKWHINKNVEGMIVAWIITETMSFALNLISNIPTQSPHLVQPASEIDDNFPGSVVVDDLKLSNVTWTEEQSKSELTP